MQRKPRVVAEIDKDLLKLLKIRAIEEDCTLKELVENALLKYLSKDGKKDQPKAA